jgi:hypothetical protein
MILVAEGAAEQAPSTARADTGLFEGSSDASQSPGYVHYRGTGHGGAHGCPHQRLIAKYR